MARARASAPFAATSHGNTAHQQCRPSQLTLFPELTRIPQFAEKVRRNPIISVGILEFHESRGYSSTSARASERARRRARRRGGVSLHGRAYRALGPISRGAAFYLPNIFLGTGGDTWTLAVTLAHTSMMQTCTHTAARGHVPACPDGAPCLPACLLVSIHFRKIFVYRHF